MDKSGKKVKSIKNQHFWNSIKALDWVRSNKDSFPYRLQTLILFVFMLNLLDPDLHKSLLCCLLAFIS